jgi:hypothetical protein
LKNPPVCTNLRTHQLSSSLKSFAWASRWLEKHLSFNAISRSLSPSTAPRPLSVGTSKSRLSTSTPITMMNLEALSVAVPPLVNRCGCLYGTRQVKRGLGRLRECITEIQTARLCAMISRTKKASTRVGFGSKISKGTPL